MYSEDWLGYDRYVMTETEIQQEGERVETAADSDYRSQLVKRVAASRNFSRAPKLQQFLLYIAKHSISGRLDLVTEYQIGVEVFRRKESYSPGEDNIVRSYARTLRKRLEEYFALDGAEEEYVLEIPRGGYVLEFKRREVVILPTLAEADEHSLASHVAQESSQLSRSEGGLRRWWVLGLAGAAVFALLLVGSYNFGKRSAENHPSSPNIHRFWTATVGDRETVMVPSDTGLTLVLGLIQKDVTVQEYVTNEHLKSLGTQFPQLQLWDRPISHRYTDLVDVMAIRQFDRTSEISSLKPTIRYARDLKVDELKKGNAILLGASNSNPWVSLFDANLNYHLHFLPTERTFRIENRKPLPGEPSEYPYASGTAQIYSYGLIAIVPNLSNTGNVLLLEGVTNSGLQAAVSTLNDEALMSVVAEKAIRSDGTIRPSEFLVRTTGVGGNSAGAEIIGSRVMH